MFQHLRWPADDAAQAEVPGRHGLRCAGTRHCNAAAACLKGGMLPRCAECFSRASRACAGRHPLESGFWDGSAAPFQEALFQTTVSSCRSGPSRGWDKTLHLQLQRARCLPGQVFSARNISVWSLCAQGPVAVVALCRTGERDVVVLLCINYPHILCVVHVVFNN